MSDKYEKLDETFNVEPVEVEVQKEDTNAKIEKIKSGSEDIRRDYEYTRGNLYSIIEKGQEAIDGILELAQESEMPRAYEVAGQLIKNVADTADKLIDLQKKMKELDAEDKKNTPSTVNNTMFVGSTADLQKMLKKQKEINKKDTK